MKKSFSLAILILLSSCREYKALMAEQSKFNSEKKLTFNDDSKEAFNVNINGINHNLFFDTGAGVTLINNAKFDLNDKKIIRQKKIYGFDKKTLSTSTTYSVDSLKTSLFTTKNKYLYVSKIENIRNCSQDKYDGILGNFFSEIENQIELNYEIGYIKIVENEIDKSGYSVLDATFNPISGKFSVKIEVNGISDYFLFDTGNKMAILINNGVYKVLPEKVATISSQNLAVNNTVMIVKIDVYQSVFAMSDDLVFNQYVGIDNTSERSILNQQFIKKFNWIIDRKNKKVYCKAININKLNSVYKIPSRKELSGEKNEKLVVTFCIENVSKYNIGDEIVSINNQKVTAANICEMQILLNKTEDWATLQLETIPAKS
ncbi:hypothetical protein [Flavobacterium sp.]|uniref:hypothetical protein n=1 Tax=Flavobacterium sp. TaxID=239 RepID=UPI002B4AD617|nr:hypothetical protein [Flavobacterium sp.]HLF51022.1 hypothetical protein [Flavobacterium sp.]